MSKNFKPLPIEERCRTQPFVVVGCLIEKDGKFLLVQEGLGSQKGLWNQPAGWLDLGEPMAAGAKREAEEETGLRLELTGFLSVYSLLRPREGKTNHCIKFIFTAKPLSENITLDHEEILDARWLNLQEIIDLDATLRDKDIIQEIKDYQAGKRSSLGDVETFTNAMP